MPTPYTGSSTSFVPFTGDPLIDGLIIGRKWGGPLGTGFSITYSFPDLDSTWSTNRFIGYDDPASKWEPWDSEYRGLDATEQNATRIAMQAWGSVANINPVETADNEDVVGDIRIAFTTGGFMDSETYAYAYTPKSNKPYAGDVWLNPFPPVATGNDFSIGAAGYSTVIHELGHALGLAHPFSIPDFPARFDTFKYTVMSYSDAPGHVDTGYSSFYPTTPMLLDIQALQYLYGPNMTYHEGDDTYRFDQGVNYYQTIWDAGGIDTIRYNATTDGALIDLRAGEFSQLGNAILLSDGVTHQDDNVAIAFDVTVENAIGGDADDEIIGNSAANTLTGSGGNDTLDGRGGIDVLRGGAGKDTLNGGAGKDTLNGGMGNDALSGGSGNDTLIYHAADASVQGGGGTDKLRIDGSGVTLDLRLIANTVHTSIEKINLTGSGDNTLTLARSDVLAISTTDTLTINGNAGDTVNAGSGWTDIGISGAYHEYQKSGAILLVDTDILAQNIFA